MSNFRGVLGLFGLELDMILDTIYHCCPVNSDCVRLWSDSLGRGDCRRALLATCKPTTTGTKDTGEWSTTMLFYGDCKVDIAEIEKLLNMV